MDSQGKKAGGYGHRPPQQTIVFGILSLDGKQLFRQYERFDSQPFIAYLEEAKKKFRKFVMIVDRELKKYSGCKGIPAKEFGNERSRILSRWFTTIECS